MPDLEKLTQLDSAELALEVSPALAHLLVESADDLLPMMFTSAF